LPRAGGGPGTKAGGGGETNCQGPARTAGGTATGEGRWKLASKPLGDGKKRKKNRWDKRDPR